MGGSSIGQLGLCQVMQHFGGGSHFASFQQHNFCLTLTDLKLSCCLKKAQIKSRLTLDQWSI